MFVKRLHSHRYITYQNKQFFLINPSFTHIRFYASYLFVQWILKATLAVHVALKSSEP